MNRQGIPPRMDAWLWTALTLWAASLAGVCVLLLPHWQSSPELVHGFLMPVALLFLLRAAARERDESPQPVLRRAGAITASLSILAMLSAAVGLLYALSFGWSHALAVTPLVLSFSCLGLLLLLGMASRGLLSAGWPGFCGATLWLLCSPIPPGTYMRLSVSLQLAVTSCVMQALELLGIPAVRHGNVIELVRGNVGVEEACSGIRSLITCLFAALLLSAALRMSRPRRLLLVAIAPLLAWGLNLLRSLSLALLTASEGPPSEAWHDGLGYGTLGLATLILLWLAFRLEQPAETNGKGQDSDAPETTPLPGWLVLSSLIPACLLVSFVLLYSRRQPAADSTAPALEQWISPQADGWEVRNGSLSEEALRVLRTTRLLQREYLRVDPAGGIDLVLYAAWWEAGAASASDVALHTPEVCWPGAGWTELALPASGAVGSPALAEHRRFRHESGQVQDVWYWHLDGDRPIRGLNPYKPSQLLGNALQHGLSAPRPQLFVRISSNRPWSEIRDSEPVRQLLAASGISGLSKQP